MARQVWARRTRRARPADPDEQPWWTDPAYLAAREPGPDPDPDDDTDE
jgi:hypothetical protein